MKYTNNVNAKSIKDKNKLIASLTTILLLSSGTFAWQSFSQVATNEVINKVDIPGARLHDYFDGQDKNVFVENYASGDYAPDVYARIRLSEYFEYGVGAGTLDADTSNITVVRGDIANDSKPLLGDSDTWDIYDYSSSLDTNNESIRTFRDLDLGGQVYYMPTFNQDNTNQDADIRGSYRDELGEVKDNPYDDYKSYGENDQELDYLITESHTSSNQTPHTAELTNNAKVMSITDWLLLEEEEQVGDYWVFDTTGWAYYAKPIVGKTATGLLLDKIIQTSNPSEEWYYAIDVKVQLATLGDWGSPSSPEDGTDDIGMYEDLTDEAMELLTKVSAMDGLVKPESEPQQDSALVEITGLSVEEILAMQNTEETLQIENEEYFVLDVGTVKTFSPNGTFEGEVEAVLLWMSEPLNDIIYTYNLLGNSSWSSSNLRAVLESVVDNDSTLGGLTLRVDTTIEAYSGIGVESYDRLYPLSYEEFEGNYQLTGDQRAITSEEIATYSWLRSPFMGTNVIMLHNANGSVNNFMESQYIGTVRPVFWAEL